MTCRSYRANWLIRITHMSMCGEANRGEFQIEISYFKRPFKNSDKEKEKKTSSMEAKNILQWLNSSLG